MKYKVELVKLFTVEVDNARSPAEAAKLAESLNQDCEATSVDGSPVFGRCEACRKIIMDEDDYFMDSEAVDFCAECWPGLALD